MKIIHVITYMKIGGHSAFCLTSYRYKLKSMMSRCLFIKKYIMNLNES